MHSNVYLPTLSETISTYKSEKILTAVTTVGFVIDVESIIL